MSVVIFNHEFISQARKLQYVIYRVHMYVYVNRVRKGLVLTHCKGEGIE